MVDLHVFALHLALVMRACLYGTRALFWDRSSQDVCGTKATSHTTAWNRRAKIPVPTQLQHMNLHCQADGVSWEENSISQLGGHVPCCISPCYVFDLGWMWAKKYLSVELARAEATEPKVAFKVFSYWLNAT